MSLEHKRTMNMDGAFTFFADMTVETTVLTPNRRLSAILRKSYTDYQSSKNHSVWETPVILPFFSWIQHCWNDYSTQQFTTPHWTLLNNSQELLLWEKIISHTKNHHLLLQAAETSQMAKAAWALLKQWQINIDHPLFNSAEDYTAFHQWAIQFQEICSTSHWIDMASMPDRIATKIEMGEIRPPSHLILYGFTEYSPQLIQFLKTCETANCLVQKISSTSKKQLPARFKHYRISLTDNEDEIETMARWAFARLKKNTSALIGCVVPSLDKIRDRVIQVFSEVFSDGPETSFNISAGKHLTKYPIIHAALQLLSLYKKTISFASFNFLLTTPFMGEAEKERLRRAKYDAILRANNVNHINLLSILGIVSNSDNIKPHPLLLSKHCSYLAKRLCDFFTQLEGLPPILSYRAWAEKFSLLLHTLGWPGERSLNSEEYQVVENWLSLLGEYQSLDTVSTPVSLTQALQVLHKMAKNHVFQSKSPDAPIQVLGLLEAAGMPFDDLWITGMDDMNWPPQPRPDPFIPKPLQRSLHMPHATAERELHFCKLMTEQFKQNADYIIFSHAEKNVELDLQPSPLIRHLPLLNKTDLMLSTHLSMADKIFQAKQVEWIKDELAPTIRSDEKIRGGVGILKHQSLCSFRAFAKWRLHAHELESPLPGLRAKDRGSLVHKTLEIIWNTVKDHSTLLELQDGQLNTLLSTSIEQSFHYVPPSHIDYPLYLALEKQRLHRLIGDWLALEKHRFPFRVINNEKNISFNIGPLNLEVRIDRIDELSDGKKLIIDYKTSKNIEIQDWFSERPEEPQLPLYALHDPGPICGITFAQIYPSEHGFKGISQSSLDIKGIKAITEIAIPANDTVIPAKAGTWELSWQDLLDKWRIVLTQLSEDFYHGVAKVDPKDALQTCKWCAFSSLCRINETHEHE